MKKINSKLVMAISFVVICLFIFGNTYADEIKITPTPQGGYTLNVKGKPFLIKGVIYSPRPIGAGYDQDFFLDENKPWLVDGKLMKEMGINCVRIYSADSDVEKVKEFIKDMYEKFGIYTIVSDWLGLWTYPGPSYGDENFRNQIKEKLLRLIEALKDEKGLLGWILGNENNYTFSGKIGFWTSPEIEKTKDGSQRIFKRAEIYYTFINELAREIKKIDKIHLVALGNGDESYLNIASKICGNIDALAIIVYRGKTFSNILSRIKSMFNKPIFLSEFGCDSYDAYKDVENQDVQAQFLINQWQEIYDTSVFSGNQAGNCLGGFIFEWTDEWWKHNEGYTPDWSVHNKEAGWSNGSYFLDIRAKDNLNMNEEWFGLISLSQEKENGLDKRVPKKAYYFLKDYLSNLPKTPLKKPAEKKNKSEPAKK